MIGRRQLGRTRPAAHQSRLRYRDDRAVATARPPMTSPGRRWTGPGSAGVRYFDTAPLYGLGVSETRLGRFLARQATLGLHGVDQGRPAPPSTTGPASRRSSFDYSRDGALRSLEDSLARLGLDRVDIALVHDIDRWTHGEAQPDRMREALDGALPALLELRVAGRRPGRRRRRQQLGGLPRRGAARRFDCVLLAGPLHPAGAGGGRRVPAALPRARDRRHHRRPVQQRHPRDRLGRAGHATTTPRHRPKS